jgi:hypothetical protein
MNFRLVGFALSMLLLGILSHSMINSAFAQTVSNGNNATTGTPSTSIASDLKLQMQTAKDASIVGMKTVTDKMKTEKGLKNKLKIVMSTSKDAMSSQMQTSMTSNTKLENQNGIQQKKVGSATSSDDKKMKHFEQIRDELMRAKFTPNPLAKAR